MRDATVTAAVAGMCAALATGCSAERWAIVTPLETPDAGLGPDAASAPGCGPYETETSSREQSAPLLGPGHAGSWSALLTGDEAGKFPSDRLLLSLSPTDARLHFAAGGPLPALRDGRSGYLCHAPGPGTCASESGFVAAFEYPLAGVRARDSILSFQLSLEQPWDEWCRLQAPVAQDLVGCDPFYDVEAAYTEASWGDPCAVRRGDEWFDIDCDRLATVERHACVCSADSCRGAARALEVNLRLVGPDVLEGALWFAADRAQVLHFERQASAGAP
jgi:hypothetical protein